MIDRAAIEEKRLLRIIADPKLTPFEREDAQRQLDTMLEKRDPTCVHCERRCSTHEGGKCQIVATFQRRVGKGLIPTESQAKELREKLAEEEAAKARSAAKREAKERQRSLF